MDIMDHEYTNHTDDSMPHIKEEESERYNAKTRWFTGYEKQELYKIMEKYKDVFNNSGTDLPSRKTKQEAWEEITSELNRRSGLNRTSSQVSLYYKNLRARAKRRLEKSMTPMEHINREIKIAPMPQKPDIIYVSSDPSELVTVEPHMLTEQNDVEIKRKKMELLDIEIVGKRKIMKIEIECAEKKKQLLDLEIAIKQKELANMK